MGKIDYIHTVQPGTGGIDDAFLNRYIGIVGSKMIPYQWRMINDDEKSGIIHDFRVAAGEIEGKHFGMVFQDEGLFKWLEAAAYNLSDHPDTPIREWADEAVRLAQKAQQENGYLLTWFMLNCPDKEFKNLLESHELVCMGNILEAGVALQQAMGDERLLNVARRLADFLCDHFCGDGPDAMLVPGHPGIEFCLVKLYRATGEERYLDLARHFLDVRGLDPEVLEKQHEAEWDRPGIFPSWKSFADHTYMQIHAPVRRQTTAEGHGVRAAYLYSGMADVYMETGDETLFQACETIWRNMTGKRMYITGGIGSSECGERFTGDYDLPNDTVYAESCASVGLALFSRRMFQCTGDGKYLDEAERAIYNTVLGSVALDGEHYFYVNPLEVWPYADRKNPSKRHVKPIRQGWYQVACCPQNTLRTLAGLREYMYFTKGDTLYIGLFAGGDAGIMLNGKEITFRTETAYPFDSRVNIRMDSPGTFTLALRDPGWSGNTRVFLNKEEIGENICREKGFIYITRNWQAGDMVTLELDMPPRIMVSHPRVRANAGKICLMKGPLVYCFEEADNNDNLSSLSIAPDATVTEKYEESLLGGTLTLKVRGTKTLEESWGEDELYRPYNVKREERELTAIPYCLWNNRGEGEMTVWVNSIS